jgi:hypothetical protein
LACTVGEGLCLQPCLTSAAAAELAAIEVLLVAVSLGEGTGSRFIDSPSAPPFSSRAAYWMLAEPCETDASACSAWGLRLPLNLKIIAYLADIDRLSTRSNLFYKNYAPPEICAACPAVKMGRHLFFECRVAATVWSQLGVVVPTAPLSIRHLPPRPRLSTFGTRGSRRSCGRVACAQGFDLQRHHLLDGAAL